MNLFWVIHVKRIKQTLVILVALIFALGVTMLEREAIHVFSNEENPQAIYKVDTKEKIIALTFDISWGEERASNILDVLQEKEVKQATFFLSAPWANAHPEIVKRIVDAGYEIGSHGYRHVKYSRLEPDEIRNELRKAHRILKEVSGQEPRVLRLPDGDFDKRVLKIAGDLQYTVIQWGTDSQDWLNPGVDQITQNVLQNTHPGDIILFHASDTAKQTAQALPSIIDQLRQQGYQFITVSSLIEGVKTESPTPTQSK